jgi:hypothetical protein
MVAGSIQAQSGLEPLLYNQQLEQQEQLEKQQQELGRQQRELEALTGRLEEQAAEQQALTRLIRQQRQQQQRLEMEQRQQFEARSKETDTPTASEIAADNQSQEDEALLRRDPVLGPLLQERDQWHADWEAAHAELATINGTYDKRLAPLQEQLRLQENQAGPIRSQVEWLTARLEQLVGMNPQFAGEDPNVRRNELNNRISQITSPELNGRVQTILDSLEPLQQELNQREALMAPLQQQHEAIRAEAEQAWQARHDQLETDLGRRWADIHGRIAAENDRRDAAA